MSDCTVSISSTTDAWTAVQWTHGAHMWPAGGDLKMGPAKFILGEETPKGEKMASRTIEYVWAFMLINTKTRDIVVQDKIVAKDRDVAVVKLARKYPEFDPESKQTSYVLDHDKSVGGEATKVAIEDE